MSYDPKVKYYLIKDANLLRMFQLLMSIRNDVLQDMRWFIKAHTVDAYLCDIGTRGNLQIRFDSFKWKFPNLDVIPKKTYINFTFTDTGIIADPDPETAAGRRLIEEQMYLLSIGTAECTELWTDEIAPLLNWKIDEEPALIYSKSKKIYIIVTDKHKEHGGPNEFQPPIGVVSISKDRAYELLGNVH